MFFVARDRGDGGDEDRARGGVARIVGKEEGSCRRQPILPIPDIHSQRRSSPYSDTCAFRVFPTTKALGEGGSTQASVPFVKYSGGHSVVYTPVGGHIVLIHLSPCICHDGGPSDRFVTGCRRTTI